MANEICYWDEVEKAQKVRDATPEELAEIDARKKAPPPPPAKSDLQIIADALVNKGVLTPDDLKGK